MDKLKKKYLDDTHQHYLHSKFIHEFKIFSYHCNYKGMSENVQAHEIVKRS